MFSDIIRGVHHFRNNIFSTRAELFAHLANGQSPQALFITCSDSRIDPNLITQSPPGGLFIMRNAGNIIPPYGAANGGEGATIEYALGALNVTDIIVCGHSHCGAMKGLLHPEALSEMPTVGAWLRHAEATRLIAQEKYEGYDDDKLAIEAAKENVLIQIENLQTHPLVAARLAAGKLKIHGWMYHFETGDVYAYEPELNQFVPMREASLSVGQFATLAPPADTANDGHAEKVAVG